MVRQQAVMVVPAVDIPVARRDGAPFASPTQAIRAVLFAWATHARLVPRRALTAWRHRLRASVVRSTGRMTARAPWMSSVRTEVCPPVLMPSQVGLPPLECWRGTRPSQAASWRPFLKVVASPTAATHAVAVSGPLPSLWASRGQASLGSHPR